MARLAAYSRWWSPSPTPRFIDGDDSDWQIEGFDACRSSSTSASTHMEWCIKDPSDVRVVGEPEKIDVAPLAFSSSSGVALQLEAGGTLSSNGNEGRVPGLAWDCTACGATANAMWRPCANCGAVKPLKAIGAAMSTAMQCMQSEHTTSSIIHHSGDHTSYKVGAMAGWAVGLDDAAKGQPHPTAFGNTALMLPAPATKKTFVARTTAFNLQLDSIREQPDAREPPMGPPPPRNKRRNYFDDEDRRMPRRRMESSRDRDGDRDGGEGSLDGSQRTSQVSMQSTFHSRERARERSILRIELQKCIKSGTKVATGSDRWEFQYEGITLITDLHKRIAITAFRGPPNRPDFMVGGPTRHAPLPVGGGVTLLPLGWMESPFDLEEDPFQPPPPTPRSAMSTPRDDDDDDRGSFRDSRSRSRSRSVSVARDAGTVGYNPYLAGSSTGAIQEYGASDPSDVLELIKAKARVVNDHALACGLRSHGVLWACDACGQPDNVAFSCCISCASPFPKDKIELAKASAQRVLNKPEDLATAAKANPLRLGTLAGYAVARYKAVKEEDEPLAHPAAFAEVEEMPPPPDRSLCSLPDLGMLGIEMAVGEAPWPALGPIPEGTSTS